MFQSIEEALAAIRIESGSESNEASYLAVCEYLIENNDQFARRVFIVIPKDASKENEERWEKVKENSEERCACGRERAILPKRPRREFEASDSGPITLAMGNEVYLKYVGEGRNSALVRFKVEEGVLVFLMNPFTPAAELHPAKRWELDRMAQVLPKKKEPPTFTTVGRAPICAINKVDLAAQTVTITPDKLVEAFDPKETQASHECVASHA